jgi:hypothetical protein
MSHVLHQYVFEAIYRFGRAASLKHQLRGDETSKSRLQFVM